MSRILIVHETPSSDCRPGRALRNRGHEVECRAGADLVVRTRGGGAVPRPDAALIDGGVSMIEGLTRLPDSGDDPLGDVPLVLVTWLDASPEFEQLVRRLGCGAVVRAPWRDTTLVAAIEGVLGSERQAHVLAGQGILVVDDSPDHRAFLDELLREHGYRVFLAGDAEEATAHVLRQRPDLIVLDYALPGEDGFRLGRRLRALAPEACQILMTGFGDEEVAHRAFMEGMDDYLAKPFRTEVLVEVLTRAVDRRLIRSCERQLRNQHRDLAETLAVFFEDSREAMVLADPEDRRILESHGEVSRLLPSCDSDHETIGVPVLPGWIEASTGPPREVLPGPDRGSAVPVEILTREIRRADRPVLLVRVRDITDRMALRQERLEAVRLGQELTHASRLAAIGTRIAQVCHELNNVLWVISSSAEAALEDHVCPPEVSKALGTIRRQADRCVSVARGLLGLAARPAAAPKPVDVNALVRASLEIHGRRGTPPGIVFLELLDPTIPLLQLDEPRLVQVLVNLYENALHAMHEGRQDGTIRVRTRRIEGWIELDVENEGPPIPADIMARLFEPFFTTRGATGGTGLGLFICRQIIQETGGSLQVAHGRTGPVFTVRLPERSPDPLTPVPPDPAGPCVSDPDPATARNA